MGYGGGVASNLVEPALIYLAGDILESDGTNEGVRINFATLPVDLNGNSPGIGWPPRVLPNINVVVDGAGGFKATADIGVTNGTGVFTHRQNASGPFYDFKVEFTPNAGDQIHIQTKAGF